MMLESPENTRRVLTFLALMAASLIGLLLLPPIHQDQNYHDFADQRTILGIPHFWNVVSNLLFIAVGAAGVAQFRRDAAIALLFLAILMTGFGSAYYHLDPNDQTLFWDRLPMAIAFMTILAMAVAERLDAKTGAILLWPLIAIVGAFSFAALALGRGEHVSAVWLVTAALCVYFIAYRFYSRFIANKVLQLDDTRVTPAERHNDGMDYVPTNKYVLYGHHFAAIAGAGPLGTSYNLKP